jgi:ATP-dependent DNA helicase PIF1
MTQKEALDILKTGVNAYITGAAGSGKTHLLNMYIDYLDDHEVNMGITASTGIAATHMGGVTIHSWTGLGVSSHINAHDLESLQEKQYLYKRLEKVKVLIIDEVSMLHHFRLDMVDQVLRAFKRSELPFGGIQVILCGDFFQLPPVSRYGEPDPKFVYHSRSWREGEFRVCYLEEQFRQRDDISLRVLNAIRLNNIDEVTMNQVRSRFRTDNGERVIQAETMTQPTRLYTHNIDVDAVNEKELEHLSGDTMTYEMETKGNPTLVDILKKSCLAPEFLNLKVGAKVMFVKNNFEAGYANGTLGVVKELEGFSSGGPVVETFSGKLIEVPVESWMVEEEGKVKAELKQYPLRLAWAITVHKSQGMSLDAVEVDLSKAFEKGMGYVALSRVRSWDGLTILGFHEKALAVDAEVLSYDKRLQTMSNSVKRELYEMREHGWLKERQEAFIRSIAPPHVFENVEVDETGKRIKKKKEKTAKVTTIQKTHQFLKEQIPLSEIARHREVGEETILTHIERLLEEKQITLAEIDYLRKSISSKKFDEIADSLLSFHSQNDDWRIGPVKSALGGKVSYRDIQLVRLFVRK